MKNLRKLIGELDQAASERFDNLLKVLSDMGRANLGIFAGEANGQENQEFGLWLRTATPQQIRSAASYLHQAKPPIVRGFLGVLRGENGRVDDPPFPLEGLDDMFDKPVGAPAVAASEGAAREPPVAGHSQPLDLPDDLESPPDAFSLDDAEEAIAPIRKRDPRAAGIWARVKSAFGAFWAGAADLVSPGKARRINRRLNRAWLLLDFDPEAALPEFEELAARAERRKPRKGTVLGEAIRRSHLGHARCLIAAGQLAEAHDPDTRSLKWGPLTDDEQRDLCEAVLAALAEDVPDYAIEVFTRFLAIPERPFAEVRAAVNQVLRRVVQPSEDRAALERAVAIARKLLRSGASYGWVQFPYAQALERSNRHTEAAEAFRQAALLEPGRAECQAGLGRVLDRLGDARGARQAWMQAYRLLPSVEFAYAAAVACQATLGTPFSAAESAAAGNLTPVAFAAKLLRFVTGQSPRHAAAWAGLGQCEWALGRPAEAAQALERAVAIEPRVADHHVLLGRCRLTLGQIAPAQQSAAAALQIAPTSDPALVLAGDVAHDAAQYADATQYYRQASVRPTEPASLDRLARANLEAGDPAITVEVLANRRPLATPLRLVLGRALARLARWTDAADVLARADSETSIEYRYYLGAALAGAGRYSAAEPHLLAARDDETWRARAIRQLGHLKYRAGDHSAAATFYAESPEGANAFDLARLALVEGSTDKARERFDGILANDPNNRAAALGRAIAIADEGDVSAIVELAADPVLGPVAHERLGGVALASGRSVTALDHLERARAGKKRLSDSLLVGLSTCYLQLGRFGEALPPLVELFGRYPDDSAVRHNLGLCRFQLGLAHTRQGRWEPARHEFAEAAPLLKRSVPAAAAGVRHWATEASYRVVTDQIKNGPAAVLPSNLAAIDVGCEEEPENPRWWLASGLSHTRAGFHADAAEAFARGREVAPGRAGFVLGYGLSLQSEGKDEAAIAAFEETIRMTAASDPAEKPGLLAVAARFALARSQVKDRLWEQAADSLGMIIDHPLIVSSNRLSPADVAQSMAVFLALAGRVDKVSELVARFEGRVSGSIGDVVTGVMRAEAGDYAGAAEMLGRAARQEPNLAVRDLAIACRLAAAAAAIRSGKLDDAVEHTKRAKDLDPANSDAAKLADAVAVYMQLQKLDPSQLGSAISQCENLMKGGKPSAQLVRSLGVLYHRKAIEAERANKGAEKAWEQCIDYWKKHIIGVDGFWDQFAIEYNLGKNRRDQLKPDDVAAWKKSLAAYMAGGHLGRVLACLKTRDVTGVRRHLKLCEQWDPDLDLGPTVVSNLVNLDEPGIGCLEAGLDVVQSAKVREALGGLVAQYWKSKEVAAFNRSMAANNQAIDLANRAIQMCNALGGAGNILAKQIARDPLQQSIQLLDEAAKEIVVAIDFAKRACKAVPDSEPHRKSLKEDEEFQQKIRKNRDSVASDLRAVS